MRQLPEFFQNLWIGVGVDLDRVANPAVAGAYCRIQAEVATEVDVALGDDLQIAEVNAPSRRLGHKPNGKAGCEGGQQKFDRIRGRIGAAKIRKVRRP